jgi:hypothetical protein
VIMNILLVGEYSGYHMNLAKGLRYLGHNVVLAGYRDGQKKMNVDYDFGSQGRSPKVVFKRLMDINKHFGFIEMASNFDVIQFINPFIFPVCGGYNQFLMKKLLSIKAKKVYAACGDDCMVLKNSMQKMRYSPWAEWIKYDLKTSDYDKVFYFKRAAIDWNNYFIERMDAVVPAMYEYKIAYEGLPTLREVTPLPVHLDSFHYSTNTVDEKMVFFHGINRYGFKGTKYVIQAFESIKNKYVESAEFIVSKSMPYEEYVKVLKKTNVVVDQVNSYSLGMNGVISMALGKVVLGGCEPESLDQYNENHSPVFNITPDVKSISQAVEYLLDNKNCISELGYQSRHFVEKHHCSIKVAKKFEQIYMSL